MPFQIPPSAATLRLSATQERLTSLPRDSRILTLANLKPRIHTLVLLLAAPLLHAQTGPDVEKNPISLLPDGSVLKGVLLPRYDAAHRLVADLSVETMTLIDEKRVQGENVLIRFYAPDRTLRGKAFLENALFDQTRSRLIAKEPVQVTNDNLVAKGSGLTYHLQSGEGFLIGPVSTWIKSPPKTSSRMKSHPATAAILAASLLPISLHAAPPKFVTPEELSAIKQEASPMKPAVDRANQSATAQLAKDSETAAQASSAAHTFIAGSGIKPIADEKPEAKPLEVNPGPDDTIITCDGGMYFDADEGVLVYLKNVKVTDPRFSLSGASELKILFEKKPDDNKADPEKEGGLSLGGANANFGDVKKLIAEGAVLIRQKGVGGKAPVEASGAVLSYDVQDGEIIIHGGFPWVKQGDFFARAKEPDLTLRLLNDGSFSTQGNWEMGGNLNLKGN